MVFSSTVFLFLFLPLVILLSYNPWIRNIRFQNGVLLLASLGFYAWGEPVFVFLMMGSIVVTWLFGLCIAHSQRHQRLILAVGILYHILILFVFKYLGFVLRQIGAVFGTETWKWEAALPIGISFFTFQMMSYLFDVYNQKAMVQKNLFRLALYVALFPQLIAGPIVRYHQIEQEITDRTQTRTDFTEGMERFVYGLAKKVLLSNYLAFVADMAFDVDARSVAAAWLGGLCYTLQIYFDFSGYSDMAIGLGRIFGFHFAENFNYPYISKSVTEFWRRWHISLSGWFRDYVYIPLGGNRVSKGRWIWNLFVVWLLTGIWHGANWTFLVWGLCYFVILLIEKLTGFPEKLGVFSHIYTMAVVIAAWVIFRSDQITDATRYLGNMFGAGSMGLADELAARMLGTGAVVILAGCVLSTPVYGAVLKKLEQRSTHAANGLRAAVCVVLFLLSVVEVVASTYSPFIYFHF